MERMSIVNKIMYILMNVFVWGLFLCIIFAITEFKSNIYTKTISNITTASIGLFLGMKFYKYLNKRFKNGKAQ